MQAIVCKVNFPLFSIPKFFSTYMERMLSRQTLFLMRSSITHYYSSFQGMKNENEKDNHCIFLLGSNWLARSRSAVVDFLHGRIVTHGRWRTGNFQILNLTVSSDILIGCYRPTIPTSSLLFLEFVLAHYIPVIFPSPTGRYRLLIYLLTLIGGCLKPSFLKII